MKLDGLKSLMVSRKFWITLIGFIGSSAAFYRGLITADAWVTSIVAFVAVLVTGIAIEDHGKNSAAHITIQSNDVSDESDGIPFA